MYPGYFYKNTVNKILKIIIDIKIINYDDKRKIINRFFQNSEEIKDILNKGVNND